MFNPPQMTLGGRVMIKKYVAWFCLSLLVTAASHAGIIKNKTYFSTVGEVNSFLWAPQRYQNDFRYDIFYYIPKSLETKTNASAVIFMHGGGSSTMDREGSIKTVLLYMKDLKKIADELGIIVVLPSANGLNWGGHTRGLLRELGWLIKKDLNIDVNRLGVSGHSMGGMGITRSYSWIADEFSFYLPMAAGMDVAWQTEPYLNKVFNVPYVHLQGLQDSFDIFVPRCEEQLKRTKELESLYGVNSKLEIVFYNGGHNYDYDLFKNTLSRLVTTAPRDLYQKELWGSLHTVKGARTENNITFDYESESRYFWIELRKTDLTVAEVVNFHAKIDNNIIRIDMPTLPKQSKELRIYLHSKMINLSKKITVELNGKIVYVRKGMYGRLRNMDTRDKGFKFEDVIKVKLN